jgi:hypothetical protein
MPEDLVSEARSIIDGIRSDVLKSVFESWKRRLFDYWNSGRNMWSKLYILILQCLSNFARVRRVRVNNEHPVRRNL